MNPKDLPAGATIPAGHDWVARARALTPILDAAAPRIDAAKGLPSDVQDALFDARIFRMLLPCSVGGAELDLPTFFEAVYAVARGDASAAWSVAQSNACAMSAAYMTPQAAAELFADPRAVLAWGFPQGPCRMTPVEGGWRVSGVWGFGSGSRHSTWLGGHCQVTDAAGTPRKKADGSARERTALFPRGAVTIVDNKWNVLGLRGTGSDTYAVKDLFVPAEHAVVPRGVGHDLQLNQDGHVDVETERRESGPLFRFSPTIAYQAGFSAVALGIARAMLDSFIKLAGEKTPSGQNVMLRDSAVIQTRVAVSEARIASMRAWLTQTLRESWEGCVATGAHAYEHRMTMRLASTYAVSEAARVVEDVYFDAGATAIFESHPFERRLRDMHAVTQQVQSRPMHLETAGQHFLGLTPNPRFL